MKRILTITAGLFLLGCIGGAGLRGPSALAQGRPGADCASDSDCGSPFLLCEPNADGTRTCQQEFGRPAYDPPAIGVVPTCRTDADCPAGFSCVRTGGQEGEDKSLGRCYLPEGVTQ